MRAAVIASLSGGHADRKASWATPRTTSPSVGVGGEQPASREGLQLGEHRLGQLVAADPPAGGAALLVDGDQPQQLPDHLLRGRGRRRRQPRRGPRRPAGPAPPGPRRAARSARPTAARRGRRPRRAGPGCRPAVAAPRRRRCRRPAGSPVVVDLDAGQSAGPSITARSASGSSGRSVCVRVGRAASSGLASSGSRNSGRRVATTCTGPAAPARSSSANRDRSRSGLGQQLLELVDHDQQVPAAPSGRGEQQVVGQPARPPSSRRSAHIGRPSRPGRAGGRTRPARGPARPPGRRRAGSPAASTSPARPPSPAADPARTSDDLPQPDGPDDQQHRALGPLGGRAQQRGELVDLAAAAEEDRVLVGVQRAQARERGAIIRPARPARRVHPPQRLGQPRPGRGRVAASCPRTGPTSAADGSHPARPARQQPAAPRLGDRQLGGAPRRPR